MGWRPERDRFEPCTHEVCDPAAATLLEDQRQRPRPECFGKLTRRVIDNCISVCLRDTQDMHDQGIEARPLLDGENLGHCAPLMRVRPETVNGLGREGDNVAAAERSRGFPDGLWRGGDDGHGNRPLA
jgi:hypothetical protein